MKGEPLAKNLGYPNEALASALLDALEKARAGRWARPSGSTGLDVSLVKT